MKKSLALLLALVMVLGSFSFVSAASFSDVEGTQYETAVDRLSKLELLKGYPDGSFQPEGSITRAEFAAVAVRARGLEQVAASAVGLPSGFTDVPAGHWAAGYVGVAGSMGIVNGIGGGLFAPNAPVKYEEAVTMLVRALGYETDAQAKGGYPYGYLIVAEEIGLVAGARGVQGTYASRGLVALLTDNALEIRMMIAIGSGDDARWVVSGTEKSEEVYLLDYMGFDTHTGRVSTGKKSNTIDLRKDDKKDDVGSLVKNLKVEKGFDYYAVDGVKVKAWADGDDLVFLTVKETVLFDAIEVDEDELTLITADETYDISEYAIGVPSDNEYDYAKVVIDSDDEVIFVEAYMFDGFIVVDEVEDEIIFGVDDDELDIEKFELVKAGKTIFAEDLEEGDVVFFNEDEDGFAVVYNMSYEGVVTRAYTKSFKLDSDTFGLNLWAIYIDGDTVGEVDADILEAFVDEKSDVVVFVDFYGDAVVLVGDAGKEVKKTYGAILTNDAKIYTDARSGNYYIPWDMVNELGEDVSFDQKTTTASGTPAKELQVVEYTVKESGKLDSVNSSLAKVTPEVTGDVETTDRYVGADRLLKTTVVFLLEGDEDEGYDVDEVFAWADAKEYFDKMTKYDVYSTEGNVDYLVVYASDAIADANKTGVVTGVKELASGKLETKIYFDGKTSTFDLTSAAAIKLGNIVDFKVNKAGDKVVGSVVDTDTLKTGAFVLETGSKTEFAIGGTSNLKLDKDTVVFKFANGKVEVIAQRYVDDYNNGTAKASMDGASTTFVKYLVLSK
ncbi:MAG: S-layer homology domain-containing protein [Gudongella sp.]|jgi:hypothetical protein|nr:S-layer homology domain-containing protein [Gudongella sp.]